MRSDRRRATAAADWEPFVREALADLVETVVETVAAEGRNDDAVVRNALLAPPSLRRRTDDAFSQWCLVDPTGRAIAVPMVAVVYDGSVVATRGTPHVACVVLALWTSVGPSQSRVVWYTPSTAEGAQTGALVPLDATLVARYGESLLPRHATFHATFLASATDASHRRICRAFAAYERLVVAASRALVALQISPSRKRRFDDDGGGGADAADSTCAICLDVRQDAVVRCRTASRCGLPTCVACWVASRGLCALCDRARINVAHRCAACAASVSIQAHEYPCLRCEQPLLCSTCYTKFGLCAPCAALL